jgi:tetratricopeptide (TPR) repeat protein
MRRVLIPIAGVVAAVIFYLVGSLWRGRVVCIELPPVSQDVTAPARLPATAPQDVVAAGTPSQPGLAVSPTAPEATLLGSSPGDLRLLAANADAFLAQRGESAFNLLAAFTATQDRRFLERALAKFPNDPAVLFVALETAEKGAAKTAMIERFKAADPNNPIAWVFSAADLFDGGKASEAVAELREALKRPAFYTYFMERAAALRELARFSGAGEFASESLGYFAQPLPHLSVAMKTSRELQAYVEAENAGGNGDGARSNVKLLHDLGKMFQTPEASRLLIGQMVGFAMERKALELAGTMLDSPLPPGESRLAELNQLKDETKSLVSVAARVYAEPPLWKEYFERFRTEGEIAALRWVNQQPPSAVVPAVKLPTPLSGLDETRPGAR